MAGSYHDDDATPTSSSSSHQNNADSVTRQSYADRIQHFSKNAAAKALLETMERKETNLCVSVDVTKKQDLLDVVDAVGQDVALIKTHMDIVEDFDMDLIDQLTSLSEKHDFLIFEDRKFADIGNTVTLQYAAGVHKIASWSHITNAHLVPGPGIISGLAKVGQPLGRGLLLLAEMSSAGSLAKGDYSKACVEEAMKDETEFVCGFIAQSRVDERYAGVGKGRDLLVLTPGIGLDVKGDGLGQQYRTPEQTIVGGGSDVIIVGRGIYGALLQPEVAIGGSLARAKAFVSVREQSQRYKEEGWRAYLKRIGASPST